MCCLFGFVDYKGSMSKQEKDRLVRILSIECEVRGTDATGISYVQGKQLHIIKKPKAAREIRFSIPADVQAVMGHTRMTTQGSASKNYNNHPFEGNLENGKFAFAHNGIIYNEDAYRSEYDLDIPQIETDSYVIVQALERIGKVDMESLSEVSESVSGMFCFTALTQNKDLFIVKGDNPMCIYNLTKKGVIIYASTQAILDAAMKRLGMAGAKKTEIVLVDGQIAQIHPSGEIEYGEFEMPEDYLYGYCGRYYNGGRYGQYRTSSITPYGWSVMDDYPGEDSVYDANQEYYQNLIDFAERIGFTEDEVRYLRQVGYSLEEIEDWLYEAVYPRYTYQKQENEFDDSEICSLPVCV